MSVTTNANFVTVLLNSTLQSIGNIVHLKHRISKPQLLNDLVQLNYGVLIGITGDIKGKLMLISKPSTFASIGKVMFGTHLQGEMLVSFSGELGNMIAGGISTTVEKEGIQINITAPTILQGEATISGYKQAIKLPVTFENQEEIDIFLLID